MPRKAEVNAFVTWILSPSAQGSTASQARAFRRKTSWCWNIPIPPPEPTGEIFDVLMIDGTYFNGWCVLIAYDGHYVRAWQWCDRENKTAYLQLLAMLAPQPYVVIDGSGALASALAQAWPEATIQRCLFRIRSATKKPPPN